MYNECEITKHERAPTSFLYNTVTVKKPINNTPLTLSRGSDTADMANMGRPRFLRSNPMVYVPDFDLAEELLQKQQGQKVHLSDDTVRSITGVNKTVKKLEKMLDNPTTLTPEGFKKLVDAIKALTYPDRQELEDAVSKNGSALAARVLEEVNKIAPPAPVAPAAPLAPAAPATPLAPAAPATPARRKLPVVSPITPVTPSPVPVPIPPPSKRSQETKIDGWASHQMNMKSGKDYQTVDELKHIANFLSKSGMPKSMITATRRTPIIKYIVAQAKTRKWDDVVKVLGL